MSTQRQHNRLDKIENRVDTKSCRLVSFVDPQLEHDPPKSFQSEEDAHSYFDEREEEPMLVIFAPRPEDKRSK